MKSLKNFVSIGIIHSMAFPYSLEEDEILHSIIHLAKDYYFDVIEIGASNHPNLMNRVKRILEESKLRVCYSGHSKLLARGLNINSLDKEEREKAVSALKEGIDEAYFIEAESFSFLSGHYEKNRVWEHIEALMASTRELCEYAKSKGNMKILLEVFDYDIDKKSILGPIELVKPFAERLCREFSNFGIMVDLSHIPMLKETPKESIIPIKDYIKHIHIGNTVIRDMNLEGYGDNHPRFGFPNSENDTQELIEFLKTLKEIEYFNNSENIISFEVKPRPHEDEEIIIAGSKRVLKEAWSKVMY